ncbi:hypothetical protein ONZ43_g2756 [Nemania bipapillata]|uniref:Uncharacterized protein n=1 Tax=Nemania bipapillata TaxID=110536 RepID=A0ACC2IZR4_9PEZI|nr:hypothetical protein ONZ43_g2756 [Nemania bipapillata]
MERPSNRDDNYDMCQETRADTERFLSAAVNNGIVGRRGRHSRSLRWSRSWPSGTRTLTRPLRLLASHAARLWTRWRRHREDAKGWRLVVTMEEHGEAPRWNGEMRLTFRDGFLDEFFNGPGRGTWVDFPSPQDIKWYLVRAPSGLEWLQGGQAPGGWAPDLSADSCIPFVMVDGRAVRDFRPHDFYDSTDQDVFDNFIRSCHH